MSSPIAAPPTLADVIAALDNRFPPDLAEAWDAVGLVVGDEDQPVRRILVAIDPTPAVISEAAEWRADLLVCHHPLLLRGATHLAENTAHGRAVASLIRSGTALFTAHTNADAARPGVNDALADALGVVECRPLEPSAALERLLLVTYVPPEYVEVLLDALSDAGAGTVGDYTRCAFRHPGQGTYEAPADARPFIGSPGAREVVDEIRVEMVVPSAAVAHVCAALREAHPYEEPAFSLLPIAGEAPTTGIGRVGTLAVPQTVRDFATTVASSLPATFHGVRVAGDPDRLVTSVAMCSGSGDSLLHAAGASGADVYVTADLRHHRVRDHLEAGGCSVIDVSHWASEWPWCPQVATVLSTDFSGSSTGSVDVRVSTIPTDPWSDHVRSAT